MRGMKTGLGRWLARIAAFAVVLTVLALAPRIAAAQGGIVADGVTTEPYGTYNGIAYVKHSGRFEGTAAGDYGVTFEIIAPADPTEGNGVVIIEPFHIVGGRPGGNAYLTPEFVFDQGFSYAGVGWHPEGDNPLQGYSMADAVEILHNFTVSLKEDPAAVAMVGTVPKLYAVGVSMTTQPLLTLLDSLFLRLFAHVARASRHGILRPITLVTSGIPGSKKPVMLRGFLIIW